MDLINKIEQLSKIGKVHIHSHDDLTFNATVDLFVKTKGTEFKIKSDFNHKTLTSALNELFDRVNESMSNVKSAVKSIEA